MFTSAECVHAPQLAFGDDTDLLCGYVTVPERRPDVTGGPPSDREIRLAVVVLKSRGDTPRPDPLIVAQGGPGGSTIDTYVDLLAGHPIRETRDIVLFDQRGTLYSEPNLVCTETFDDLSELLMLTGEEADARALALMAECRDRLAGAGIDLAAYNSLENAADVQAVRHALGYDEFNFYGVSYGTLLGLHLMERHPEGLRSAILDGVVAPQTNFITRAFQSQDRAFDELFAACKADASCADQYPELEPRFFALIERLNEEPIQVTLTDPDTGQRYPAVLSGDDLAEFVFQLFYISGAASIVPRVVADLEAGEYSFLELILSLLVFDRTMSEGMYQSVVCSEETDFTAADGAVEGVHPHFAAGAADELQSYLDACALWEVPALWPAIDEPVESAIPTLLLSGQFDPITPPAFAAAAAAGLSNSTNVVLPKGGHGVAFGVDSCVDEIVGAFLDDPTAAPETGCLGEVGPLRFAPASALIVPLVGRLNSLDAGTLRRTGAAGLLLLGVLSAPFVWSLGWLIRRLSDRPSALSAEERRRRRLRRGLVVVFALLALFFVFALGAVIVGSVFREDSLLLLSALPRLAAPLFVVPWLLLGLALAILWAAVRMWWVRQESIPARAYYTLLAICAAGYVAVLALDGLFTVLLT